MATATDYPPLKFTAFHLFAGIGGGALGALKSRANWMSVPGVMYNIGAIDVDPLACEDYRNLTGSPITCMDLFDREQYQVFHGHEPPSDWHEATPADIQAAAGGQYPDTVFLSAPCKGFSGLLPNKSAASAKYQALNRLTVRGIRLTLEAFANKPPKILLFENVPRIKTRGKYLMDEIKALLKKHGYACHDADHDCGVIGGLGQRRKRYLMIARHEASCKPFVYQPPARPLKTIGDVIGPLPLPDDPSMGPMHRLPRLKWLTWLRLALIPAGGDWRDLQKITPESYRITGSSRLTGSSPAAIPDPRLAESRGVFPNRFRVVRWEGPAPVVTGDTDVQCGAPTINDPRLHHAPRPGNYGVLRMDETSGAVVGGQGVGVSNGPQAIADTRLDSDSRSGYMHVLGMDETSPAVIGAARVTASNGPSVVADHRLGCAPREGTYGVMPWGDASQTVIGGMNVHSCQASIEDPRLGCSPRGNSKVPMGVQGFGETASTVFGSMDIHSGPAAVADIRIPGNNDRLDPPPVIISLDGTWHRPLTTMELLALQSFPLHFADGRPVVLAGKSDSAWRERIGNAVPPEASRRMYDQILLALVQNALGETFALSEQGTDIWVAPKNIIAHHNGYNQHQVLLTTNTKHQFVTHEATA